METVAEQWTGRYLSGERRAELLAQRAACHRRMIRLIEKRIAACRLAIREHEIQAAKDEWLVKFGYITTELPPTTFVPPPKGFLE